MLNHKVLNSIISALMVVSLLLGGATQASAAPGNNPVVAESVSAMPGSATDGTKVPHYFGPWPNWANSPYTLPNATVEIVNSGTGTGSGATALAQVDPVTGGIASIQITSPGSGYTAADVIINGGDGLATATATVNASGVVTSVTLDVQGGGYTSPVVSFSGGGGTGTLVSIGNQIVDRAYATDNDTQVFVVVPTPLPSGVLQSFQSLNQALAGASVAPSAGYSFNAYVLRPTGVANEYQVVFDSGLLTVPPLADPAVSEIATFPVGNIAVQASDVIAFYGQGIPLDIGAGVDLLSYPAPLAPIQGNTITLGSAEFPLLAQARTYSFGAQVLDQSAVPPVVNATGTAYGGVDAVSITDGGFGYSMPTVDFDLPDAPDGVIAKAHADMDANGTIVAVVVDDPGSGYLTAPGVAIHNGTLFDPIAGATPATLSSTLMVTSVTVDTFGSGYVSAPTVNFSDQTGTGAGAAATAFVDIGGVTDVTVINSGSGYLTVGMRKFIDDLPGLCVPPNCPTTGKYIPVAVPEAKIYNGIEADEYVIGVVQYRTSFSSDLPSTLVRGYVQLETPANAGISQSYPLQNELLDGTFADTGYFGVTAPQWLGPIIAATKNKPVRIVFHNLLPMGADGDLFLPVDATMMGSGMGPMMMMPPMNDDSVIDEVRNPPCGEDPKGMGCFKDNRATLHLHGGITPWISDGTAHQWITPAGEMTDWPQGVSVSEVPDMNVCAANDDGCQTFYYTNQQSARLLFYHDHSWGITRLNVYAGEAAGYLISDDTEAALLASGAVPADQIPLIVQDRTFVPDAAQLALQDPTWDVARWGGKGNFWYHHVYMPAQNPGDAGGMSAYGRWMYGPWFWPPAADTVYGPIANPYYNMDPATNFTTPLAVPCNVDDPTTWQYDTDPFCEPQQIPGTPNISAGMEQFNDTPIVNGVAYPKVTLEPKSYRFRVLNAANDRFFNFQWYVADPTQGNGLTEVALKAAEVEAAQTDPVVFPTPDTNISLPGPDWIQIGTEGGFLPAPVVVDGQQVTTWITDPTRFDVGNVDLHSLLLAPAERADVIVDFSKFAGKTLILYNDAPAAFPARVPSYDYYTGAPDLSPVGAPTTLPGYGPNTRTIMQVTIAGTPAPAFNLTKLRNAFKHNANGTGVFESGQHPIIVGQAAYNSAYGTSFAASSNCNAPGSTLQRCDGLVRVSDTSTFGFNTLRAPNVKMSIPLQPKAIHDETNASTFDEYGRMTANLGIEAQPPTPGQQNVTLYPFVNPGTELIDGTNLPKNHVIYDANGLPVDDVTITPISNAADGTQIWRVTHNGVDTHPIHFHLYDVQLVNRVTWDNIIIPTEPTELGWKDTVRMAPLEDTIVALRPIVPEVPWELPNAIRMLNPMMPEGSTAMFHNFDVQGIPTANITNQLVNFGWEYVYHCHILSHEEMDMMRPVTLALPPLKPDGLVFDTGTQTLTWNDNSITETAFVVQRTDISMVWADLMTILSPLDDPSNPSDQPNIHEVRTYTDTTFQPDTYYQYRVVAKNTVGYGAEFPSLSVQSISDPITIGTLPAPAAPSNLTATLLAGPQVQLQWTDNAAIETGSSIERCTGSGCADFASIDGVGADITTYTDLTVAANASYSYRVIAFNASGDSLPSNVATITTGTRKAPPPDFDGNGTTDIAVYRPSSGIWIAQGQPMTWWGEPDDIPVPGDYDGNGATDIAVYRPSGGIWIVNGPTGANMTWWGEPGDQPVPGDYDGNGTTDIAVYRPSGGIWIVNGPTGANMTWWGEPGDIPVPADYDGNGTTDIAVYRPSGGIWIINSPTGANITWWGEPGDIPVPGDYDGNGAAEIGVYRPSTGLWITQSASGATITGWGEATDTPVPGDYDGNGITDLAVYRPSTGYWFIHGQTADTITWWGETGDIPLSKKP
jgi:FtsP/CotA-like multicopper oxidase with cupredoxin domain